MSLDWIYDLILAALPSYGGANILRAKRGLTIPIAPFVTYQALSLDASGFEFKISDSALRADPISDPPVTPLPIGTFDRTFQQNCPLSIQVDCYSPTGMEDVRTIVSAIRSDENFAILDSARVAFLSAGVIKNLDFLGDNDYRDRWSVTLDFMIALTRTEAKNAILEWNIDGTIDVATGEIDVTINA